jgi:hypothetical protein
MNDNNIKPKTPIEAAMEVITEFKGSLRTIDEICEVIKDHREFTTMKLEMAEEALVNLILGEQNDKQSI